jgi:hypothetical protein
MKALVQWRENPAGWLASKAGLSVDVGCHAVAGWLIMSAVAEWAPWWLVLFVWPLGVAHYAATNTRWLLPVGVEKSGPVALHPQLEERS